jgi:hypothetical protein
VDLTAVEDLKNLANASPIIWLIGQTPTFVQCFIANYRCVHIVGLGESNYFPLCRVDLPGVEGASPAWFIIDHTNYRKCSLIAESAVYNAYFILHKMQKLKEKGFNFEHIQFGELGRHLFFLKAISSFIIKNVIFWTVWCP